MKGWNLDGHLHRGTECEDGSFAWKRQCPSPRSSCKNRGPCAYPSFVHLSSKVRIAGMQHQIVTGEQGSFTVVLPPSVPTHMAWVRVAFNVLVCHRKSLHVCLKRANLERGLFSGTCTPMRVNTDRVATLTVTFGPILMPGEYAVAVLLEQQHASGSPATLRVYPAPMRRPMSSVVGLTNPIDSIPWSVHSSTLATRSLCCRSPSFSIGTSSLMGNARSLGPEPLHGTEAEASQRSRCLNRRDFVISNGRASPLLEYRGTQRLVHVAKLSDTTMEEATHDGSRLDLADGTSLALQAAETRLTGSGLSCAKCGEVTSFFLHAPTRSSKCHISGGYRFVVSLSRPDAACHERCGAKVLEVLEREDGSYVISYVCSLVGVHAITVSIVDPAGHDPVPVAGSPFFVAVL
mmetsp:Transcript_19478/g.32521  ORF Transcript_19478/g.32521 Transcript_19478/m.32521 type:complete len:405 (-) Transcript_19478:170-1384(-)